MPDKSEIEAGGAGPWDTYAICTGCGARHKATFGKLFFVECEVCPRCGEPKQGWPIRTLRYVSTGRLFSPSTWGTGYWQDRAAPPSIQDQS